MSFKFGSCLIPNQLVFWQGTYSYALVNLRPIRPNHVLVCPMRLIHRYQDMQSHELQEIMQVTAKISRELGGVTSIAIQDGKEAGQSVQHLHVHIVPRQSGKVFHVDSSSQNRSQEEMALEAYRLKLNLNLD